jgi:hypothetical protein
MFLRSSSNVEPEYRFYEVAGYDKKTDMMTLNGFYATITITKVEAKQHKYTLVDETDPAVQEWLANKATHDAGEQHAKFTRVQAKLPAGEEDHAGARGTNESYITLESETD